MREFHTYFNSKHTLLFSSLLIIFLFIWSAVVLDSAIVQALTGAFSVILTGFLVLLYSQQKEVLENQERIMAADYVPKLSYNGQGIISTEAQETLGSGKNLQHEAPRFNAYNNGNDRAENIRTEIVVSGKIPHPEDFGRRKERIESIVREADVAEPAKRSNSGLKSPFDSLEAGEADTFTGNSYFRYYPTDETYQRFQDFSPPGLNPGDYFMILIVVKYQDILNDDYTDVPLVQIYKYVPDTPLNEFPTTGENVQNPSQAILNNFKVDL